MRNKIILLLLLLYSIIIGCCSSSPNTQTLVGKYFFNNYKNDSLKEFIVIYPDKTYKHQFKSDNGNVFENKGIWSYDSIGCEILFNDFLFFNNEGSLYGNKGGNWYSRIKMNDNEIKLMYSSENNIYFSKKNTQKSELH